MIGRILLALGSALLCLLGAEVVLAVIAPQVHRLPDVWMHDATLGWKHRNGASGRMVTPEFDVAYQIDAAGRRRHADPDCHPDCSRALRVQLYGDSFAEGWGVEADSGLAALLQQEVRAGDHGVTVENYGVAGYGTDQELLLFSRTGVQQAPDLALVLFYVNDLWNNISRRGVGAQRGAKPIFRPNPAGGLQLQGTPIPDPGPPPPLSLEQQLRQRSHLWALASRAAAAERAMPAEQVRHFYGGLYGRDQSPYRSVWMLTELLLAEFATRCRQQGVELVLVYAPAIVQIEAQDWRSKRELHDLTGEYDLQNPNRQIEQIAARHGIRYIDLLPAFAAASETQTLYFRDSHWNEAGHRLAAVEVARALDDLNVTELPARRTGLPARRTGP